MPSRFHIQTKGFGAADKRMRLAGFRLKREVARNWRRLGVISVRRMKQRVGGGGGLGSVSGDTRAAFGFRVYENRGRKSTVLIVGPIRNRKGNLLRVHEDGLTVTTKGRRRAVHTRTYPKRAVVEPVVEASRGDARRLLGVAVRKV